MAIFSISETFPNSARPDMMRAGGPAGITIIVNHNIGSSRRKLVFRARK
jgi:hypothetical protein